ncbi:16S rRNA methyltransferase, partial [Pseudomonas aeruginosa]|nr:16S rRNA methyltransferase [Pseudomonas aeruginosa]
MTAADGTDGAPRDPAATISTPPSPQGVPPTSQPPDRPPNRAPEHRAPGGKLRLFPNSFLNSPPL